MDAILARLEALEQEVRELRARPARVEAPFYVVSAEGRTMLEVSCGESGSSLRLFDEAGETIARLGALGEGASLALRDHQGDVVAILGGTDQGGYLDINSGEGKPVAVVAAIHGRGEVVAVTDHGAVELSNPQ
jgi:hypothetical protein